MPETPSNMPPGISAEADNRLSQIADAAAKGLGEDVRRELRGHLDELYLRYRTPTAPLSELDAMTLVEKHFGDPARVRKMLLRARPVREMPIDRLFFRRICALVIVASGIQALVAMICVPLGMIYFQSRAAAGVWDLLVLLAGPIVMWVVGVHYGLAGSSGRPMPRWMRRPSLSVLAVSSVGAIILCGTVVGLTQLALDAFFPTIVDDRMLYIGDNFFHWVDTAHFWWSFPSIWEVAISELAIFAGVFGMWPYVWMKWCEPSIHTRRVGPAAIGIIAFAASSTISRFSAALCLHFCGALGWPWFWLRMLSLQPNSLFADLILAGGAFTISICLGLMCRIPRIAWA